MHYPALLRCEGFKTPRNEAQKNPTNPPILQILMLLPRLNQNLQNFRIDKIKNVPHPKILQILSSCKS